MKTDNLILFGRVLKPHGVKGEIRIDLKNLLLENETLESVFVEIDGKLVPFFVNSLSDKGPFGVCSLEGIDSYKQAAALKSKSIFIEKFGVSVSNDNQDLNNLVEYHVEDQNHGNIGEVTGIEEGPQTRLVVSRNGGEILIPYVDDIILGIDPESRKITIDLPEGFLDIYE